MGTASDVVNGYLGAFAAGELDRAADYLAAGFSFSGPFARYETKQEFPAGASPLTAVLRGHQMLRQWEDGEDVCSVFLLNLASPLGAASVLTSEWNTVSDDLITSSRLVFDTAAFRAAVPIR
jgi:hypothetical protein